MSAYKPQCPCTIGKTIVVHGLVTTRHLLYKTLKKYTLSWLGVKIRLNTFVNIITSSVPILMA